MPVYIYQNDALARMGEVEGERWLKLQDDHKESAYGFHRYLDAWREIVSQGYEGEASPSELVDDGDGSIYGEGGYARYVVDAHGEIKLLKWSTRPERIAKAEAAGFRVV